MAQGARRYRTAATAIVAIVVTGWALLGSGAGAALADDRGAFLEATNASRQELAGAPSLVRAADLDEIAGRHAQAMLAAGKLFHNPNLADEVQNWSVVAENVGVGIDVPSIHQALLDSPSHRANILHARVTQLGIGVARADDGSLWIVEVFRKPIEAAPAPAPTPAPAPAAAAAPAAAPVDAPAAPAPAPTVRRPRPPAAPAPAAPAPVVAVEAPAPEPVAVAVAVAEPPAPAVETVETFDIDLTPEAPYVPSTPHVTLSTTELVSSADTPGTSGPAVPLAVALWVIVALSMLHRLRRDTVQAIVLVRRIAARTA